MGTLRSVTTAIGLTLATTVFGTACAGSGGTDGFHRSVGAITRAEHAQNAPKPECKSLPIPASGMHCINTNGKWSWGVVKFKEQSCPFLKLEYVTKENRLVTMIAGALKSPDSNDEKICGVQPPKRDETKGVEGFRMKYCPGGNAQDEIIELRVGFLFTLVGPPAEGRGADRAYWPLIVRTRSIPAGAFGTTFVLMGSDLVTRNKDGEIEIVARPNQKENCDNAGEKDGMIGNLVLAQPKSAVEVSLMTETSAVRWIKGAASGIPETLEADEKRFLSDVCKFAQLAMKETTDNTPRLEVIKCNVEK